MRLLSAKKPNVLSNRIVKTGAVHILMVALGGSSKISMLSSLIVDWLNSTSTSLSVEGTASKLSEIET